MARFTRIASIAGGVLAASLATATGAHAAVPKTGSWNSGSHTEPTVSFEVRGPASRRTIHRVSLPKQCKGDAEPTGEISFNLNGRMGPSGRIRITGGEFALRLHFVTPTRAEAALRMHSICNGNWHYVVRHSRPRVPVRTGRWLALVRARRPRWSSRSAPSGGSPKPSTSPAWLPRRARTVPHGPCLS
jgi:hypothetical protein